MSNKVITFVYIGQEFYWKSGTRMGIFFELLPNGELGGAGMGDIEIALMNGNEAYVRKANKKEMAYANMQLQQILSSY